MTNVPGVRPRIVLGLLALLAVSSPAAATIQLAQATAEVWEAQGSIAVCLTRTPVDATPAEYYAIAVPGTASGTDFTMTWVSVYTPWPGLNSTVQLTLNITNDTIVEGDETVSVVMTARSGGSNITGSPSTIVITIHDGAGPATTACGGGGPTPTPSPTPTPTPVWTPVPTPTGTPNLSITGLVPNSGPPAGGTNFAIVGSGFQPGASVHIGGYPATGETWFSGGQLDAVSPPGLAAGALHSLTLENPPGGGFGVLVDGWLSDFYDVPAAHPFHYFVEILVRNRVTAGCGGGNYCPDAPVTREQMAVFLLVAKEGIGYSPPACATPMFADVPCSSPFAPWINELANPARDITAGCGSGAYCPTLPVTREEMAVFLLRTLEGPTYVPPPCVTPVFADAPCSSPFARWINELYTRGITGGCGGGIFCCHASVTRGQMAVFLATTFALPPGLPEGAHARPLLRWSPPGEADSGTPSGLPGLAAVAVAALSVALALLRAGPMA